MNTVRMAVAAMRSAADDLMKTDPVLATHIELGTASRLIVEQLLAGEPVRVKHVGGLILELAQRLEANYR